MTKTAKEWFDKLPSPYNKMAIRYLPKRKAVRYSKASIALCCVFVWNDTEEGYDFWEGIHDNIHAVNNFQ